MYVNVQGRRSSSLPETTDGVDGIQSAEEKKTESANAVKFFRRFSSLKTEFEKDKRRTLNSFKSKSYRSSDATFLRTKEELTTLLRAKLDEDNLQEWYVEVYSLLFPTQQMVSKTLNNFLQQQFFLDSFTHDRLVKLSQKKNTGQRVLYVEVIEGKNLPAMDANGLSDPFCTLYVTTKESSKRTKVAEKTLCPVWKESFKFSVKDFETDFLRISVWDHDPEERMRDKLKRIGEIKSPSRFKDIFREVSHGRSSAQEFIGKVIIPIKEISSEILEKWYPLDKSTGEVYLSLALGVEKEKAEATRGYRVVLQLLVMNELLKGNPMVPFHWENKFEPWGTYLLRQLKSGWGLKDKDLRLAKWIAYTNIHVVFPLSGRIFPPMAHEVFQYAIDTEYNVQEISLALRAASDYIEFAADFIEKIHDFYPCMVTVSQLYYILKTLDVLSKSIEGLRSSCGASQWNTSWISSNTNISAISIFNTIQHSIRVGALNSFKKVMETCKKSEAEQVLPFENESQQLLTVGQLLNEDLQKGLQVVDKDFRMIFGQDFHVITYGIYDREYAILVEPMVGELCSCLKSLCEPRKKSVVKQEGAAVTQPEDSVDSKTTKDTAATKKFLGLYFTLKQFAELSPVFSPGGGGQDTSFKRWIIRDSFHEWFYPGVGYLLDLLSQKWMQWMKNAVEKDFQNDNDEFDLYNYEEKFQISSSALDCVQIFTNQVKELWTTLAWPDAEQSKILAEKIFRDLCGFSVCYADLVSENLQKFEKEKTTTLGFYQITERLCRSVNNIDYVGKHTREIAEQLTMVPETFAGRFIVTPSTNEYNFTDKQLEIQKSGLNGVTLGIFRSMGIKIHSEIHKHLFKLMQVDEEKDSSGYQNLLQEWFNFYGKNLEVLGQHLLTSYFEDAIRDLWEETVQAALAIMNSGIQSEKSWKYFKGLKKLLDILKCYMEAAFLHYNPSKSPSFTNTHTFLHIINKLDTYGETTSALKVCYYENRLKKQQASGGGGNGILSARTCYVRKSETLYVEILNARNLPSSDSNGLSDPYVGIEIVPAEDFPEVKRQFTKVQKGTLFPLFDETFQIKLDEHNFKKDGYLHFSLFDHDFMSKDKFIGESFISFRDISQSTSAKSLQELQQKLLQLTKPSVQDGKLLKELIGYRSYDKNAVRFIRNELEKI